MNVPIDDLIIRDLKNSDIPLLRQIVLEKNIVRFMKDWSENSKVPGRLEGYVEWLQTQSASTDVYENKRYAIALAKTDELIGMIGMGQEETSGEVEVAYFIRESCQHRGYATKAVNALVNWCFQVSKLPYLILTIDCANTASCKLAEKCGFELYEKRTPIGHKQPNMESDSYYYYRRYREKKKSVSLEDFRFTYVDGSHEDFALLCTKLDEALDELVGTKFQRSVYSQYNLRDDIHDVVIAYLDGKPVGCGSFKKYDDEHAELKRVFVDPACRGTGLSKEIVRRVEQHAKEQGYHYCILETGELLKAACHLYHKLGYERIPNYGQYKDMPNSICMQRKL